MLRIALLYGRDAATISRIVFHKFPVDFTRSEIEHLHGEANASFSASLFAEDVPFFSFSKFIMIL